MLPSRLQVGLKEWATVCDALGSGGQIVLFRKGGINDTGGVFELEERQFLLFPTYLHQKADMLKPAARSKIQPFDAEPATVTLSLAAEVTDVLKVTDRAVADRIDDEHIWSPAQLDMRFNYKPDKPLFVVLLRVYRLIQPVMIANSPTYAGCRSWVPLDEWVNVADATAALGDEDYAVKREAIVSRLTR